MTPTVTWRLVAALRNVRELAATLATETPLTACNEAQAETFAGELDEILDYLRGVRKALAKIRSAGANAKSKPEELKAKTPRRARR